MRHSDPRAETPDRPRTDLSKVATGVRGLDDVLQGGIPAGRTTLITGGPGTGKTVLGVEIAYHGAAAGDPALLVSFEEGEQALRDNAATLGFDLAGLEESRRLGILHAKLPEGAVRSGDFDLRGLLAVLGARVEDLGARRIVLDAVDQLARVFADPERERSQLHLLHDWLQERELTAVLTLKAEPGGQLIYPFLGFLADCVVHLDQRMESQVRTRRLRVVKYRGSGFLGNELPYLVTADGVLVMPVALADLRWSSDRKLVSSGDDAFDEILGGGYRAGSAVLIAGPTGAGKTTLASLFAAAACDRGEEVLFVTLEESRGGVVSGMRVAGVDLEPAIDDGRLQLLSVMPESQGIEEHLFRIVSLLERFGGRHLVLDAISACRRMGSETAALDFLVRLISEARRRGVTILMTNQTAHPEQIHQVSGIGVSSMIDTVVLIHYVPDDNALRRRLLVLKSRGARHSNRYHWLEIGERGISLSAAGSEPGEIPAGHLPPNGRAG